MSCNCKKDNEGFLEAAPKLNVESNTSKVKKIKDYFLKTILYVVLLTIGIPVILVSFTIVLFKMVVLSKEFNLLPAIKYIAEKLMKVDKENDKDDDDDDENYDDYEYELLNPNEITVLK